jgi:putative transposase
MSHSFCRVCIHAIWATKERYPFIQQTIEQEVYALIETEFRECGCTVRIINGAPDHVHSLFFLNPQKSLSDVFKQVKGGSSHSTNQQNLLKEKFSWQTGYAAFSVSESMVEKVFLYIKHQKQHHQKMIFLMEFQELMKLHGLDYKKHSGYMIPPTVKTVG